jgi:hypothetical protein
MKASSRGLIVAVFLCAVSCYGTTVIVMRTAGGVLVAADAKVIRQGSNAPPRCKIHQYGNVFVAIASVSENDRAGLDTERIVRTAIATPGPLFSKVESFRSVASKYLLADVESVKKSNPSFYEQAYRGKRILDVTFASMNADMPEAVVQTFFVDGTGTLHDLRSPLGDHRVLATGMTNAIKSYTDQNSDWYSQLGPDVAIKKLMELEIASNKDAVGPPVSILKMDAGGARWVEPGACPAIRK